MVESSITPQKSPTSSQKSPVFHGKYPKSSAKSPTFTINSKQRNVTRQVLAEYAERVLYLTERAQNSPQKPHIHRKPYIHNRIKGAQCNEAGAREVHAKIALSFTGRAQNSPPKPYIHQKLVQAQGDEAGARGVWQNGCIPQHRRGRGQCYPTKSHIHTKHKQAQCDGAGRGGGLGSSTVFKKFHETYDPLSMVLNDGA